MEKLASILGWIFGILLIFTGLLATIEGQWLAIFFIFIGCFLLPPIKILVFKITSKQLSTAHRAGIISILAFCMLAGIIITSEKETPKELQVTKVEEYHTDSPENAVNWSYPSNLVNQIQGSVLINDLNSIEIYQQDQNALRFRLHYKSKQPHPLEKVQYDTRSIVKTAIEILLANQINPNSSHKSLVISSRAYSPAEESVTGSKSERSYGGSFYYPENDNIIWSNK
ncbi:DUF456 domain-containing protein [Zooshikella sp. RANM57]|uniref:DUF456 domain-containing protein n=1 Tax=Zooshikella sp. RANM57 TaxID=3425863 RepID=UPI003D6F69C1